MCLIRIPFDPAPVFGKVRAPILVSINGYSYRSTIAAMRGEFVVPLRKSHREAAGLEGGENVEVTVALDESKREIQRPADLVEALRASPGSWERWQKMSFTHQREHVEAIESASKVETRARRVERAVASAQSSSRKRA